MMHRYLVRSLKSHTGCRGDCTASCQHVGHLKHGFTESPSAHSLTLAKLAQEKGADQADQSRGLFRVQSSTKSELLDPWLESNVARNQCAPLIVPLCGLCPCQVLFPSFRSFQMPPLCHNIIQYPNRLERVFFLKWCWTLHLFLKMGLSAPSRLPMGPSMTYSHQVRAPVPGTRHDESSSACCRRLGVYAGPMA